MDACKSFIHSDCNLNEWKLNDFRINHCFCYYKVWVAVKLLSTIIEDASGLYLLTSSAVDCLCLKLMSKENNDAG